jgi:hypothetical protein
MKKFSLLLLSFFLLSCSSDDEEAATKEGDFLDVYNGVVWKYTDALDTKDNNWYIFSPQSMITYDGECIKLTSLWGVKDGEGNTHTVDKNSKNLLNITNLDSASGESMTFTLTVSENGNVITAKASIPSGQSETETWNKVSEACK